MPEAVGVIKDSQPKPDAVRPVTGVDLRLEVDRKAGLDRLLFKSLDHPLAGSEGIARAKLTRFLIEGEYGKLTDEQKRQISSAYKKILCDPGLASTFELKPDIVANIKAIDPKYVERKGEEVLVYNRKTILKIAASEILGGKNVAFVNFDLKDLRMADKAGYADVILRDFVKTMKMVAGEPEFMDLDLTAARVGGDEFCFFCTSGKKLDRKKIEQAYARVNEIISAKVGYYFNEGTGKVERRKNAIKSPGEENPFVFAEDKKCGKS